MSDVRQWTVDVEGRTVTAALDQAAGGERVPLFFCAHGAGGSMADRGVLAISGLLRERGMDVVRFNFPYSEARSRRPDPMPLLQATIAAVVAAVGPTIDATARIIGGRSMGGRAASMLAAGGFACDALLLLAYPLHPAGDPAKLRDAHLPRVAPPTLCVNGTRDALCRRDLMAAVVSRLPASFRMHWLEDADHSFHVPKSSGRTDRQVLDEIGDCVDAWLRDAVIRRPAADRRNLR